MAVHRIRRAGRLGRALGLARAGSARPPVRFFPGWAGTLLWWPFPVDYAATGLPADLVADLAAWERRWEIRAGEVDPSEGDTAADDGGTAAGEQHLLRALAGRVAEQLGSGYCLELDAPGRLRRRKLLIASDQPGAPAVVAAFEALEADAADELDPRRPAPGAKSRFYACAPLSGETFDPSGVRRRRGRGDEV